MKLLSGLFILSIPVFLVTVTVAWAINDLRLYDNGFEKYNVSNTTGIDREELSQIGRDIRTYFNSTHGTLAIEATIYGEKREVFGTREILHMKDVKRMVWGVYILVVVTFAYLLGVGLGGFILKGSVFTKILSHWLMLGGALTLGLIGLSGLIVLIAFDQVFLAFHRVSFANDFWKLDPSRDYLLMMFPEGFWFDCTLSVIVLIIGGAVLLSVVGLGYLLSTKTDRD